MALALVITLGLASQLGSGGRTAAPGNTTAASPFLPAGKVRHLVLTGTLSILAGARDGEPLSKEVHHEEFWLTQGTSHPLMRSAVSVPVSSTT